VWPCHLVRLKVEVNLSLCFIKHHAMNTYWRSGGIAPHIPNLGARWKWVASFTPRPLYPWVKNTRYSLDRSLYGPQSWSGCGGKQKNSKPLPGIEPRSCSPQPSCHTDRPYPGSRTIESVTVFCVFWMWYSCLTADIMFPSSPVLLHRHWRKMFCGVKSEFVDFTWEDSWWNCKGLALNMKTLLSVGTTSLFHFVFFAVTNSTERSLTSETDSHSVGQEIRNSKIYCFVHKTPPLDPVLSQLNQVYILAPYFFKTLFLILSSHPRTCLPVVLSLSLFQGKILCAFLISRPSHPPWIVHPNSMVWNVQVVKPIQQYYFIFIIVVCVCDVRHMSNTKYTHNGRRFKARCFVVSVDGS